MLIVFVGGKMKQYRIALRGLPFLGACLLLASTTFAQSLDCPYDIDSDGQVDTNDLVLALSDSDFSGADLGQLLAAYGPCPQCPGDLDGNGVVNGGDLSIALVNYSDDSKLDSVITILANWGVVCDSPIEAVLQAAPGAEASSNPLQQAKVTTGKPSTKK